MSETNAIAEGVASTSSEETKNPQPSSEPTQAAQSAEAETSSTEGEQKPDGSNKAARAPSERIKEVITQRNEAEVRAHVAEQKERSAQNEIRRLQKVLGDAGISEQKRQAVEGRIEEKKLELEESASALDETKTEMRTARFTLFSEKVGDEKIVKAFCELPRVSEELADLVAESDLAAPLAAHLASKPAEARRLSALPPHRLGAELARMERTLEAQPSVRRVSQAPEPGLTLKGGSSPAGKSLYDPSLSIEDYAARRMPQINKARR